MKKNSFVVLGVVGAVVAGIAYFVSASSTSVSELDKPTQELSAKERVTLNANHNVTPVSAVKPEKEPTVAPSPVQPDQVKFPLHTHKKEHAAERNPADQPVRSAKEKEITKVTYNPQRDMVLIMPAGIGPLSEEGSSGKWSVVSPVASAAESAQVRQALARRERGFRQAQIKNVSPYARFRKAQQTRF